MIAYLRELFERSSLLFLESYEDVTFGIMPRHLQISVCRDDKILIL